MSPAEIREADEAAQALAEHSARVHSAVDAALACIARWLLAIGCGTVLGVHAINVLTGGA
jgi:hypothetical protein